MSSAKSILKKIGGLDFAKDTIESIQRGIAKKEEKGTLKDLFSRKMTTILIIAFGLAFFQQITGINAIFYYAPTIFEQAGGSADSSFLQAIVVGLTNLVFTLVAIWLIDKLGRKPLLIIGTFTMAIALSMATIAFNNATYTINNSSIEKIENVHIKTEISHLEGQTYTSQNELFNAIEPLLLKEDFIADARFFKNCSSSFFPRTPAILCIKTRFR